MFNLAHPCISVGMGCIETGQITRDCRITERTVITREGSVWFSIALNDVLSNYTGCGHEALLVTAVLFTELGQDNCLE